MNILTWVANNIFGTPAILLGIIVFIGLLLQKKTASQLITGTFKAIIGFLIISAGAGIITGALNIFEPMWKVVFGIQVPPMQGFLGQTKFNEQFGSAVTLAMSIGFLINILLARLTKLKYIYLTGHMMFWTTTIFAGIIINTAGNVSFWPLVIFLSVFMGLYWTIQPALTQPFMKRITKNDQIALGHTSASVALLGAGLGKLFGNKENDAEKIKVPKGLEFIRDSNVITGLTMGVLFLIGSFFVLSAGKNPVAAELIKNAGTQNFAIYSIIQALTFTGGIAVVLMGVRMFIGELIPAFKGIATRLVPGARPALDVPVVYPYSPNAVTLGFIGTLVGALIWLLVLGQGIGYVFVPTMIVLFFHGAAAGVFGNITGGVRGALLGGFITSTVVAWGQYLMVTNMITKTIPDTAMWAADSDMFILGPIVQLFAKILF
ncbi:PTS system IIC component, L-Asc family [Seinonella peptonophila]|uniref:Ascorbate-specific PTS system EIIC component n=1 Tax=Seinonella peptonophila TaxID=112248 RepID=A0A1M4SX12_9BACL|nr:PTS ascorbate transporter subunit IIC [Seinonella peptonophila]SHE36744.1 PTS system IIC component, L-Asc family [Seinonella peptonophila]